MEERISGVKDTIEEIDTLVKQNTKSKYFGHKRPENQVYYEKTKPKNNRNKRRSPAQRSRKYFNKITEKFPNLKDMPIKAQEA